MKINKLGWFKILSIVAATILITSCSGKSSPTITTPTYNLNGPEIEASIGWNPVSQAAQLDLVNNASGGAAVTNAAVTVTLSGGGTPVTYTTSAGPVAYYANTLSSWTAGGTYTMSIQSSLGNFSDSVVAVGNIAVTSGTSGVTCTWTGGGNENTISVENLTSFASTVFGPNVTSPYVIPLGAFTGSAPTTYLVSPSLTNLKASAFPNSYPGSFFSSSAQNSVTVIR
jgi:hypothetical protein